MLLVTKSIDSLGRLCKWACNFIPLKRMFTLEQRPRSHKKDFTKTINSITLLVAELVFSPIRLTFSILVYAIWFNENTHVPEFSQDPPYKIFTGTWGLLEPRLLIVSMPCVHQNGTTIFVFLSFYCLSNVPFCPSIHSFPLYFHWKKLDLSI